MTVIFDLLFKSKQYSELWLWWKSKPSFCSKLSFYLPHCSTWMDCVLVLIFHLPIHQFHLNSNQRQALKRRECSSSSMKIDVKLPTGKATLISVNQCVLGRSLYLKIEKVTGISDLFRCYFIEDPWYNHIFHYEIMGWRMENVLVYLLKV